MNIRYIGYFPPPYGGVTIKNRLLYDELSKSLRIKHFTKPFFISGKLYQALNVLLALLPGQTLLIGISSKGGKSGLLTKLLYQYNRKSMHRSLYFMMGGTEAGHIAENAEELERYSHYKQIYVETGSMATCLKEAGLRNISVYPNGRKRPKPAVVPQRKGKLKCVFFSLMRPEKGVDLILQAARDLPEVDFTFYGQIDRTYQAVFEAEAVKLGNVEYKGVFTGNSEEVYAELRYYDVLLFPTRWANEGVPGVLVEAKIAGIPAVVSDICFNAELVADGLEGIVLEENDKDHLIDVIQKLDADRELLYRLKLGSRDSAKKYYIDNYVDGILKQLEAI